MEQDDFGDRMKKYEADASTFLTPGKPTYIRLDGRGFSKFTKGAVRPYDVHISWAMKKTTEELVRQFKPDMAYTQSDEISLGWFNRDAEFSGRVQKLVSVMASVATARFNHACLQIGPHWSTKARHMLPSFDARVFQVGDVGELVNAFYWRQQDCKKNAISMAARAHFSHKELQHMTSNRMVVMMRDKEIEFYDYPEFFRNGTILRRESREVPISQLQISNPKFAAVGDTVTRSRIVRVRELPRGFWQFHETRVDFWTQESDKGA